ncbi:MAG: hypothetical protein IJ819_10510 [Clostridiales bacterium]|nr:hypothetical protein [Clostridiales bacterium]
MKIKGKTVIILLLIVLALVSGTVICYIYKDRITYRYNRYRAHQHKYEVYGGMTEELKDSDFFEDMQSGKSFCFLGDSVTSGTVTYGIHWYEPLLPYIKGNVTYLSYPGWEVKTLIDHRDIIVPADVYVIAIGINDALTLGEKSISASQFTDRCDHLANRIRNINPDAKIYFIAPWNYLGFDDERMKRGDEFRIALGEWCSKTEYGFINPDPAVTEAFAKEGPAKFMYNQFHPKAPEGIELFSYAVLKSAHDQRSSKG